jgi:3'-phosphoadenosine 5'-phosphosulfate (PAPS) 3'-phosphatase
MPFVTSALATTLAVAVTAGPVIAPVYEAKKAEKAADRRQDELLAAQEKAVKDAEDKAASATSLASQEAKSRTRKQRLLQTNTILTSPLGITGEASVTSNTLGG